jgi:6-phosphogluconolactonase
MKATALFVILLIAPFYGNTLHGVGKKTAEKSDCYIYVSVNSEKKIVVYKLDHVNEKLIFTSELKLSGEPGSLCTDPENKKLFAALRDINSVASLGIDGRSGSLTQLKDTRVAENPVYISTDKNGRFLLFTSYSGNVHAVYTLEPGGVNGNPVQLLEARINPHMIKSDASGKFVFVPNKGGDIIQQFILQDNGFLKPNAPDGITVRKNSGPRHFTFNPAESVMYVVNELACTVLVFHYNKKNGTLEGPFQEITTKPEGFTGRNTCADIHISPDGKFLYASNRGHDSLAGFLVDAGTGKLIHNGWYPTEKEPREFAIEPSGKFLIAAGESSGWISFYRIRKDGSLLFLERHEAGHWPVWVLPVMLNN